MSKIVNRELSSNATRKLIFNYLYKYTEPQYETININSLKIIGKFKNFDYVAIAKNQGTKVWLIFMENNGIYYRVSFPCHYRDKQNTVTIFPLDIQFPASIYNGTILEATLFNTVDGKKTFVVDNVILFDGSVRNTYTREDNLSELNIKLKSTIRNDSIEIYCSYIYNINSNELTNLYNFISENNNIESVVFVPNSTSRDKNYIYYVNDSDKDKNTLTVINGIFLMRKTNKPDVYNLYSEDGNEVDQAYIPTLELSKQCKLWFDKKSEILVKCRKKNNKWIPIELIKDV